ncbi:MAG: tetratricopeptide repeat protein [Armatimonadetes bacterium]|nr:tetratricopeptide repeat protein [Armatimonadota bacterium]
MIRGLSIAMALTATIVCGLRPGWSASRPLVLIFETVRGDGADKDIAAATTKALRTYFRETQQVEATVLDRDSPTVLRAVMEKKLSPEKLASYATREERLEVAKALGFQYAAAAEVSVKDVKIEEVGPSLMKVLPKETEGRADADKLTPGGENKTDKGETRPMRQVRVVEIKLWLARVDGGKNSQWESVRSSQVGGTSAIDLQNAMNSAASAAVIEISQSAFAGLPRVPEQSPVTGKETNIIGAEQMPTTTKTGAKDYAAEAEESIKVGNLALAIEQYKRAVNLEPTDVSLRVKLAEAYARKGLYREAEDELARAREMGAEQDTVAALEELVRKLREGEEKTLTDTSKHDENKSTPEPPSPRNRVSLTTPRPAAAPGTAVAKMIEGDKLWNAGKPDEAAQAYKEAAKIDPKDWRAHERLAVVNASMSLFGESRRALNELAKVQPAPPSKVLANRYEMLRHYFDQHFAALIRQYETASADFEKKIITRESYYNTVKGLVLRLESMAGFLDAIVPPPIKRPAHLRRSLACGLMAQAAASLLDYLETNSSKSKSNAEIFAAQAKVETQSAAKLEENKVIVERETSRLPTEQPSASGEVAPSASTPGADHQNGTSPQYESAPPPDYYPASPSP